MPILVLLFVCFSLLPGTSFSSPQQGPTVIADSVGDFSGNQGNNGWFYGYWDQSSDQDGVYDQASDFRQLVQFGGDPINGLSQHSEFTTGELWYLKDGHYYTSLWAEGGHPHGTMDLGAYEKADHWVVRRWISSVDSDVEILGHAGKVMPWGENWAGDVKFQVVVGGSRVYEAAFSDGGEGYSVRATVQAGTPVDFLIGPGSGIGVMKFTGTIKVFQPDTARGAAYESINQRERASSLEALKERSVYASLDRESVEDLARDAQANWPAEFSGFAYQRVERFSAGEVSHWISIWRHRETDLEFVLLPGGKFQMGSPASESGRKEDELLDWVTLDPFLVARTECTWKAWTQVAGETGKRGNPYAGSDNLPISGVGPLDVDAWCHETLLTFPTEAQWEYMCRAGTTTAWSMGENKNDLIRFANIGSLECPEDWVKMDGITEPWYDGYGAQPAEVGMFECNAFGLFDVHGNLSEWCRDDYFDYGMVKAEKGTGMRPGVSGERLARGGNYGGDAFAARSARRLTAGSGTSSGGNHGFGFRPSLDLSF